MNYNTYALVKIIVLLFFQKVIRSRRHTAGNSSHGYDDEHLPDANALRISAGEVLDLICPALLLSFLKIIVFVEAASVRV